ncbi:CMGC family protein kinase [Histomonas meleagridis]|uniref:CMGC family protein kinase n=1 Tax=Histomonas meleagridis TaxID=135588 RepID=UPI00355A8996|nr:CMGC family protein kinase [Histomonas meleagridis]KAH0798482.1 CMGC family protein kinase [Histomonas meleagridis]
MKVSPQHKNAIYDISGNVIYPYLSPGINLYSNNEYYQVQSFLGAGAFGQVYSVKQRSTGKEYALKIGRNTPGQSDQLHNEINIYFTLNQFLNNDELESFCHIIDSFQDSNYIVMILEKIDCSLLDFLDKRGFVGLTLNYVQLILRGLLRAVRLLHNLELIHTDIKPENIMFQKVDNRSLVKLIDFGAVCRSDSNIPIYTQTLFYRAPEVFLHLPKNYKMDIWSIGCVLAECYLGLPIFAGGSSLEVMRLIEERIGLFPQEMIRMSPRRAEYFNGNRVKQPGEGEKRDKQFDYKFRTLRENVYFQKYPNECQEEKDEFFDLLRGMLAIDPEERFTIEQIENHPFTIRQM